MHCPKCGNPLADDASFCNQCGSAVQPSAPATAESEPPPVTVLIEPGAGVWTPAPDAASAEESAPVAPAAAASYGAPAAPPLASAAIPQPLFTAVNAGFWRRFAAFLIDWFVFSSIEIFIAAARGIPLTARQTTDPVEAGKVLIINLFIFWLYWAIFESSPWQATIGKRAMDIYVTDLQGRRINFAKASARYFGKILSFMILFVGFLMAGFTARKQALHDMLAGCLVIRRAG